MKRATIHNPATGRLQPVDVITDRAKRYRAVKANAQEDRRCIYCGRPDDGDLHTEHINGREADNAPENLAFACRSCNTAKGAHFARIGAGVRTAQYNPTWDGRKITAAERERAYAEEDADQEAAAKHAEWVRQQAERSLKRRNPTKTGGAANVGEWTQAVGAIIPHKGAKYAGSNYGLVSSMSTGDAVAMIRATPPAKRAEFASKLRKKQRSRRDEVPF